MKKSYILAASLLLLSAGTQVSYGQYILDKANEQAAVYNYSVAKELYENAYAKKPTVDAARGVAESYRHMKNYVWAESWYSKVVANKEHVPEDEYRYAEVLIANSKYSEAMNMLQQYKTKKPDDITAQKMYEGCALAGDRLQNPVKGSLSNMAAFNSKNSDWGLVQYKGKFIFSSDDSKDSIGHIPGYSTKNVRKNVYGWTGAGYLHLYESNGKDTIKTLLKDVNGDYHTASPSFTADGKTMYYAVTSYVKKSRSFLGKEEPYTMNVQIKCREWDESKQAWGQEKDFPYNSGLNYSVGDPFISADGNTLYFVSDKENGSGGTDIYYSQKDVSGKWGEPINMGGEINTAGNERTPFIDSDGNFYYSSDGMAGMGGLDIYKAVRRQNGGWLVTNMGSPINTAQDDFAPYLSDAQTLYFASDRPGGKGYDDIYKFDITKILHFSLTGNVFNKDTKRPISDAVVTLVNQTTGVEIKNVTNSRGAFSFGLDESNDYAIKVVKTDYANLREENLTTKGLTESETIHRDLYLLQVATSGVDTSTGVVTHDPKAVKLENIYYDLDKWNIRPDAKPELDKLVQLLKDNPTWKVELGSHTDSRANDAYNLKLSQRRAESVVSYLVQKGIDKKRLTAKGYGETQPVNGCVNGVKCTEAEYQMNRRTEFKVLEQ